MDKKSDPEDITLPSDNTSADSKSAVGENREMSTEAKANLEKEKQFEFREAANRQLRTEEEKKKAKRDLIFKFIIGSAAVIFLMILYFWLIG